MLQAALLEASDASSKSARCSTPPRRKSQPDYPTFAYKSRILPPPTWFGLLETRRVGEPGTFAWRYVREYHTAPLFDRALAFKAEVAASIGSKH